MRTSLITSARIQQNGGAVDVTVQGDDLGDGTSLEPADPTVTTVNGINRPTGVRYNFTIQSLVVAGFTDIEAQPAALWTLTITYADASTVTLSNVGATIRETAVGSGGVDQLQGWEFSGSGFGATTGDVIAIAPAFS